MSVAFSNSIDEKSISWNSQSLMSNSSAWRVTSGAATLGNEITLQSNSEIELYLDCTENNIKCNYLKLLAHLTCDDTTLTTDNVHNVCVIYEVQFLYNDENGVAKEDIKMYEYYPKYDFESSFDKDYTVVQSMGGYIKYVNITIVNYESVPVKITGTGLYVNYTVDEETVNSTVERAMSTYVPTTFDKASCIDVLDDDPDPSTVPNGINKPYCYMWILSSAIS